MKNITQHFSYCLGLITISLLLSSCFGMYKNNTSEKSGSVPPDFEKPASTLVIIKEGRKSFDKYLIKHVKKQYKGSYVMVDKADIGKIDSSAYADKTKYRYIFGRSKSSSSNTARLNPQTGRMEYPPESSSFFVIDRLEQKTYRSRVSSSMFAKMIKAYMINLEEKRLQQNSN